MPGLPVDPGPGVPGLPVDPSLVCPVSPACDTGHLAKCPVSGASSEQKAFPPVYLLLVMLPAAWARPKAPPGATAGVAERGKEPARATPRGSGRRRAVWLGLRAAGQGQEWCRTHVVSP